MSTSFYLFVLKYLFLLVVSILGRHLHDRYRHLLPQTSITNNMNNPRLPPYPHPTTVYPLVQIRQNIAIPGIGSSSSVALKGKAHGQGASAAESVCVAACFAPSRGWVAGSPSLSKDRAGSNHSFIHSFILAISIPLQVHYYSEVLPTTARMLYRSFTPKRHRQL